MINLYIEQVKVVRAVKFENTLESISECVRFVTGSADEKAFVRNIWGMKIVTPGLVMGLEFGNYIVKDAQGEFHVFYEEGVFDSRYTKLSVGEDWIKKDIIEHTKINPNQMHDLKALFSLFGVSWLYYNDHREVYIFDNGRNRPLIDSNNLASLFHNGCTQIDIRAAIDKGEV